MPQSKSDQFIKEFSTPRLRLDVNATSHKVEREFVTLGGRLIDKGDLIDLLHEFGHFLELPARRVATYNWGFSYGKTVEVLGRVFHEPQTPQASFHEVKAMAYQVSLLRFYGVKHDTKKIISALFHMHDWYMVPGKGKEARLEYLHNLLLTELENPKYSMEHIKKNWKTKVKELEKIFLKRSLEKDSI